MTPLSSSCSILFIVIHCLILKIFRCCTIARFAQFRFCFENQFSMVVLSARDASLFVWFIVSENFGHPDVSLLKGGILPAFRFLFLDIEYEQKFDYLFGFFNVLLAHYPEDRISFARRGNIYILLPFSRFVCQFVSNKKYNHNFW